MEPEGSLPHPQELCTCSHIEPDHPVHTTPSCLCKIILMLSIHPHLGLPSGLFPSGFPTNNLYTFLFSPIHTPCLTHVILQDLIILILLGEEYKSYSLLLCSFCSALNVRDQVSHPYRTTGKSILLYILIFTVFHGK
jgi:hypothetical protein